MAIATSTAIALGGLAVSAGTTGMSFAQASKQNKLQRQAEEDAARAMDAARKKLDVNFYKELAIQKEPYELEREALLSQGAQAIQAGQESERGAQAIAGKVQMAQQAGQRQIAGAMGQEMANLDKLAAAESSRLAGEQAGIDLQEATGAQLAAREAQRAANAATAQGVQGIGNIASQAIALAPLYSKTPSAKITNQIENVGAQKLGMQQSDIQKSIASLGVIDNVDFSKVGGMSDFQFKDFMGKVNPITLSKVQQSFPNAASSFRPNSYAFPNLYSQPSVLGEYLIPKHWRLIKNK